MAGITVGQEVTEEPPVITETPVVTEVPTELPTLAPTETPTPDPPPEATEPAVVPTETTMPPTETLAPELTPESTAVPEVTAEPSLVPTLPALPAEPALSLLLNDSFEAGSVGWLPAPGVSLVSSEGGQALEIAPEALATLAYEPFYNVAAQARFLLGEAGIARLSIRQQGTSGYTALVAANGRVDLYRDAVLIKALVVVPPQPGQWRTLRFSVMDGVLRVAIDGVELLAELDSVPLPAGRIALHASGSAVRVDDFQLWGAAGEVLVPITVTPTVPTEATQMSGAVEAAVLSYLDVVPSYGIVFDPASVKQSDKWAIGAVGIMAAPETHASPSWLIFLAQQRDAGWVVSIGGTTEFWEWFNQIPDSLLTPEVKQILSASFNTNVETNASSPTPNLGFPFPVGQTWAFSGGPHNNKGAGWPRPWNALDFANGWWQPVVAADEGVAIKPCANLVVMFHPNGWQTGYYHLTNINVEGWSYYARWWQLGTTSEEAVCGGSADGPHVHFTLYRDLPFTATYPDINYGVDWTGIHLGGWEVEPTTTNYAGCVRRLYDGARVCAGGQIYNEGMIGPGAPKPPTNLTAAPASMTQINLSWVDESVNETGFALERSTDNVNWSSAGSVGANVTSYADTGLDCATSYHYRVRAAGGGGYSDYSNTASATTSSCIKPTLGPVLLTPTNGNRINDNTPVLSWRPVSNPSVMYEVQVDTTNTFAAPLVFTATTKVTSIEVAPPLADALYYWRVRAKNAAGSGSWSTTWYFTVDTVPPGAPTLSLPANGAITSSSRPTMTWGAMTGVNQYRLQVSSDANFANAVTVDKALTSHVPATSMGQGLWYWRVAARDIAGNWGAYSLARTFTINIQTSPANEYNYVTTTTARPSFVWTAVTGATGYTLEVATDSAFSAIIYTSPTSMATSHLLPVANALGYDTYYWRVRITNLPNVSPVYRQFSVTPTLPVRPVLIKPANLEKTNINPPTFTWNAVTYAYGSVTYNVQIATSSTFATVIFGASNMSITTLGLNNPLPQANYCWRVQAVNQYGAKGPWSIANCFTIDTTPPPPPTLLAPANGAITSASRPTLSWSAVTDVNRYSVQIASNANFTNAQTIERTTTTYPLPTPLAQGLWYWRVAARDVAGNWGAYSATRTFTVN
ncbi:MAG: fibronectin type III domain-containing protein, partial [Anaerolineae bacterium]|nr:fibronectin type III domain-containing protein [Anaerolineae bacterium]